MSRLASNTGAAPEQLLNGRYRVVEVLNNAGWSRTYIAVDNHQPDKPNCVIKQIQPVNNEPDCLEAARRLFNREVHILKTLGHHNQVPQLLDCTEVEHVFYLVQEFVAGQPLSEELSSGQRWSENQVIQLLHEVVDILAFVHNHGIIHSDLQPDKLIRRQQDGRLVLTGFNALNQVRVQIVAIPEQLSATVALGALGYMAMEQVRGQPRPSSDIYALGMIGIQALTGLNPVQLEEDPQTGEVIWRQQATVSDELAAILTTMVRYHFKDRYQSATHVLEALHSLDSSDPSTQSAVAPQSPEPPTPLRPATSDSETATTPDTATNSTAPHPTQTSASSASNASKKISMGAAGLATSLSLGLAVGAGYFLLQSPNSFDLFDQGQATLAQAAQKYQAGNLQEAVALAQSISSKSKAYQDAQAAMQQWQQDWKNAEAQFEAVKKASAESQWQDVLTQSRRMPNIAFWQQKIEPMVQQAQAKLEPEANQLLQQAYNLAADKDFTGALDKLKRIPEGTKAYANVQSKTAEYAQKHRIKADYILQQAYNRAADKDFTGALAYLEQVPKDTPAYATAQQKIREYTQKQRIRANYLLQRAYNRSFLKDFAGALAYLKQVPVDTPSYAIAQQKILEYTQKQRLKAAAEKTTSTTELANEPTVEQPFKPEPFTRSSLGNQSNVKELSPGRVAPISGNLNPGNQLREVTPQPSPIPQTYPVSGEDFSDNNAE